METDGRWHLLLNRQIPVFTFFASNAVVNWQRAHGGRSSYKARRPQPDPTTTGILPLVASLARGTVLRCLYGVLCYSVYVPIFLYVDSAYRVSPCSLWENRRKQTRLSSHHSLPIRSFASPSPSFATTRTYVRSIASDRREIFRNFFSFSRSGDDRCLRRFALRKRALARYSLSLLFRHSFFLSFSPQWPLVGTDRAVERFLSKLFLGSNTRIDTRTGNVVYKQSTRSRRGEIIRQLFWKKTGIFLLFSSLPFFPFLSFYP